MSVSTGPVRFRTLRLLAAAVFAAALLLSLRPSAEAATYRTHIARVPDVPTSAETARIWINSDTAFGETAGVATFINGYWTKHLGTFDSGGYPGANWRVDLPAQPNGTFVQYQLFTRNESGDDYAFTSFDWSYTVNDGDVQWAQLFHNSFNGYFRSPFGAVAAGTSVTLRFDTAANDVDSVAVRVYTYDPATGNTAGPVDTPLTFVNNSGGAAHWQVNLATPSSPAILYYHFVITDGLDVDYYGDDHSGPHDNLNQGGTGAASDNQGAEGFQLTVYDPAFQTPDWLQNAVVYQIFPDRFRNGDTTNDYCRSGGTTGCPLFYGDQDALLREPWNTLIGDPRQPGPYQNEYGTQFYGGDLQGLIDKLDYLQAAGFDTIYTTPIFDGSSNHRYDTDDYMQIDPALGTQADFDALIAALDARGMHLIVDGVFNHTSSDSVYFDRYHRYAGNNGACESLASDYRDWFEFQNNNVPCGDGDYTGWFGYSSLAVLVDNSADVRDTIYRASNSVVDTWYDRGVAGWRFDVADEISHDWWRDFRPYAKADNANGPLVGEVWYDASNFLLGDQLDSVMNYRFRKNVLGFVRQAGFADNDNNGNNEIISLTPSQFDRALMAVREDYPAEATMAMFNLLDSHDTNRLRYLVDILGESDAQTLQRQKLAALFQYTYMGAPTVYYGDEVAIDSPSLANGTNGPEDDPYNRAPYPWADEAGDANAYGPADADMLAFYSRLAALRAAYPALRDGEFVTAVVGDLTGSANDNTTYGFWRYGSGEPVFVALNPGNSANTIDVYTFINDGSVWEDMLTGNIYNALNGGVSVTLPPRTGIVLAKAVASLTVEKTVNGDATGLNDWQFSVNGNNAYTVPAAGGEFSITGIITGTTTVAEMGVGGWTAAVSCDNGVNGTDAAIFNLATGQDVTCTFTNTQDITPRGHVTIVKNVVGAPPGSAWAFSGDLGPFTLPSTGGGITYSDQPTGSKTINETYVPGWATTVNCTPGSETGGRSVTLTLDDGETAMCTFTNTLCQPGYYDDMSACVPADPGYYTDVAGAVAPIACVPGYYQPYQAQTACLSADAGYYVDTPAATGQTACPANTISPPASDSIDDCVATTADLTIVKATDPAGGTGFPFTLDPGAATFADKWGSNGVGQGDFNGPFGIATDTDGNVYVADTFAYRVQKFDADGNFILMWGRDVQVGGVTSFEICLASESCKAGTNGSGNGEFNLPHGIAVDGHGNVYVSDSSNDRIQKFDADGNYVGQWGGNGDNGGQFDNPTGVAVDGAGNVYVADSFNNRIQKFGPAGNFLFTWGYDVLDDGTSHADFEICTASDDCWAGIGGNGDGQLDDPFGVAVYGGTVYVADTFNHRIQMFATNGNYLDKWGSQGSGDGQFKYPYGLTTDAAGNIYVADTNFFAGNTNDRIQKFNAAGGYLGQWGSEGTNDGQFQSPTGVAASGASIYVTEYEGHRVQRFSQTGATLNDGQSHTFTGLTPNTYLVSELVPANWTLDDIDCGAATVTESGNTVSVTLAAGDDVTCTFSNSYTAPDTTPPDTTIDTHPSNPSASGSAAFTFSGDDGGGSGVASFQCKLDGGSFTTCTSPQNYSGLSDGSHTFQVRATDAAGNVDPTPASYTWVIDTTPPDTTITGNPSNPSASGSASFTFSGDDGGGSGVASFQCKLDGGAFTACTSPQNYSGLSDGSHTFQVRATDAAGNVDPTPASYTWVIDTTPPDTTPPDTTIDTHPSNPSASGSASFTFSGDDGGGSGVASFECSLDGGSFTACTSPQTYTGLSDGIHTFQVRATDAAGNTDPTPASFTWVIDTTPPDTTITGNPSNPSASGSAAFTFSGDDGGGSGVASFQCKLDGGAFTACTSPQNYSGLSDGSHTFQVRAIDTAGNVDPTPASFTWVIDTTPPDTTITGNPSNPSASGSASFTFSGDDGGGSGVASFQCKLDGGAFTACTSPQNYSGLSDGSHTFQVRATDAAGNVDPTPASYTWVIDTTPPDTTPPDTTITGNPSNPSASGSASFTFSGDDGGGSGVASFQCKLDGGAFTACTSPQNYSGLSDGSHTFQVRAIDTAGNTDPTPASYTWVIDTTPPDTTITGNPSNPSASGSAAFTFSGDDGGGSGVASFQCKLDGGSFTTCTSPQNYSGLSDGSHTFQVRAIDTAGNVDPTPASFTWVIDTTPPDTTPPDTTITGNPSNPSASGSASFTFSGDDGGGSGVASFQCKLDGGAFTACTSPQNYSGLSDGSHTFQVRATDAAGNTDPTPASYTWVIDTTPPDTTITGNPSNPSASGSASFTFSGDDGGGSGVASFQCKLDGGAFTACTSPQNYSGLSDGSHTFQVRATDAAGNVDPTPASFTWVIDTTPPVTGALYVTASGGSVPGAGAYQKNDILKWNGSAWSIWFDGATAGLPATAQIAAFDVDNDAAGSAWVVIRQAMKLPGVGKMQPYQIAYYNGSTWSRFFDGGDVGLKTTGERINGLEVLPGAVSPIGTGCQYYLLISTVAGGGVGTRPNAINFTGEDVLGFCMTQSGVNTTGSWHLVFEGQSEGLQKNNNLGLSANADAGTLYFTTKSNFTGDGGLVKPSELFSWSGGTFSGPLWKAKDHGLMQVVDGIDVVGNIP